MKQPQTPFTIVFDKEEDGRWIAEVLRMPGVLAYGATKAEARRRVLAIALRTLADRMEQGKVARSVGKLFSHERVAVR